MSITRNVNITIDSDKCTLDKNIILYKDDNGISINFSLVNLEYSVVRTIVAMSLDTFDSVDILVSKPNRKTSCITNIPIVEGKIKLDITKGLTDVVGEYLFQLRLLDDSGGRMTLPPCTYKVLEPIAIY